MKISAMATMWMRKMMVSAREIFELLSSASISVAGALPAAATRCLRLRVTALETAEAFLWGPDGV